MKLSSATFLLLAAVHQSAGELSCPMELTQSLYLTPTLDLYYDVVVATSVDEKNILCARLESRTEGWLGFGISPSGGMAPAEAVIGLPDDVTVLKYDMSQKSSSGVVPMDDDKQTLMNKSIVQENGSTVMTFSKYLDEDTYPLSDGENTCIFAEGGSNTFGYHGSSRGQFTLNLDTAASTTTDAPSMGDATTTQPPVAAPSDGNPSSPESAPTDGNPSSPDSGAKGRGVVGTMLISFGAVVVWFAM